MAARWRITEKTARRVLDVVSKGLTRGIDDLDPNDLDRPKPGHMCVEAAVCYALGQEHDDRPLCVTDAVRSAKIDFNDNLRWVSNRERARGLRRLAIAQLGSRGVVEGRAFRKGLDAIDDAYLDVTTCATNRDAYRFAYAEDVVQLLVRLKSPGTRFLYLAAVPREVAWNRREMQALAG